MTNHLLVITFLSLLALPAQSQSDCYKLGDTTFCNNYPESGEVVTTECYTIGESTFCNWFFKTPSRRGFLMQVNKRGPCPLCPCSVTIQPLWMTIQNNLNSTKKSRSSIQTQLTYCLDRFGRVNNLYRNVHLSKDPSWEDKYFLGLYNLLEEIEIVSHSHHY